MPGGGRFVTASNIIGWQVFVNNPETSHSTQCSTPMTTSTVFPTPACSSGHTGCFDWSLGRAPGYQALAKSPVS